MGKILRSKDSLPSPPDIILAPVEKHGGFFVSKNLMISVRVYNL
jgi:hypothetical protein